jgi:Protein of unknown function (DUF3500)
MRRPVLATSLLSLLAPLALAHDASVEMTASAKAWLSSLTPDQKAKASFEFGGTERTDWHFIPRARKGLPIKEMTQEQRLLAHGLLATGLSHRGYTKAVSIMSLEAVLAELEKGKGPARDPEQYFVSIFGTPGVEPWGWRVEGHHLSLNFTAAGGAAPSMTPSFFGTNPGEVKEGARAGTRVLGNEEELGRSLIKSLSDDQKAKAIILKDAPKDILNVPGRNDTKAEGIAWADLNAGQREGLMKLIQEYVGRHRPDVATEDLEKVKKAGVEKIYFAWAGGLERGEPHYYRVQGGNFVLEYDNVQNGANHVHSVWRDFDHDFGTDLLGEHYKAAHAK